MWPDQVSNLGSLALESNALPTALRGPAISVLNLENDNEEIVSSSYTQLYAV